MSPAGLLTSNRPIHRHMADLVLILRHDDGSLEAVNVSQILSLETVPESFSCAPDSPHVGPRSPLVSPDSRIHRAWMSNAMPAG